MPGERIPAQTSEYFRGVQPEREQNNRASKARGGNSRGGANYDRGSRRGSRRGCRRYRGME